MSPLSTCQRARSLLQCDPRAPWGPLRAPQAGAIFLPESVLLNRWQVSFKCDNIPVSQICIFEHTIANSCRCQKKRRKVRYSRGCVLNLSVIYSSHPQGVRPSTYSKYSQTNTGFEAHTDVNICQLRRNARPVYQMCLVFNTNTYMHNLAQSKLSRTFDIALKCTL